MIALLIYPDRAVILPVPDGPAAKYCSPGQAMHLSTGVILDNREGSYWARCPASECRWEDGEAVPGELPEKKFGHVRDEQPTVELRVARRRRKGAA